MHERSTHHHTLHDQGHLHPHAKLSLSLMIALALWIPSLMAVLGGQLDLLSGAMRFVLALVGTRFAIGGLSHLWSAYVPHHELAMVEVPVAGPARVVEATLLDPDSGLTAFD